MSDQSKVDVDALWLKMNRATPEFDHAPLKLRTVRPSLSPSRRTAGDVSSLKGSVVIATKAMGVAAAGSLDVSNTLNLLTLSDTLSPATAAAAHTQCTTAASSEQQAPCEDDGVVTCQFAEAGATTPCPQKEKPPQPQPQPPLPLPPVSQMQIPAASAGAAAAATVRRDFNTLSAARGVTKADRLQSLTRLLKAIRKLDTSAAGHANALPSKGNDAAAVLLCEALTNEKSMKCMLKCFGDQSERCRVLAVRYLISLCKLIDMKTPEPMKDVDDPDCNARTGSPVPHGIGGANINIGVNVDVDLVPALVLPIVLNCLGGSGNGGSGNAGSGNGGSGGGGNGNGKESSEDVRHLFALLVECLAKRCGELLSTFQTETFAILAVLAHDSCPTVLVAACVSLRAVLMATMPSMSVPNEQCEHMVSELADAMCHRHSKVRIAAIQAVRDLIFFGGQQAVRFMTGFREANVLSIKSFYESDVRTNYFAKLSKDQNVHVRTKFYEVIADFMENHPYRCDYETLTTPLVLAALADDQPAIARAAVATTRRLGDKYVVDFEHRVKDQLRHATQRDELLREDTMGLKPVVFFPFEERAPLSSRLLFGGFLRRFHFAIGNEITDWMSKTRVKSIHLLRNLLYFSEDSCAEFVDKLLAILWRALANEELVTPALECLALIGRHAPTELVVPPLLVALREGGMPHARGPTGSLSLGIVGSRLSSSLGSKKTVDGEARVLQMLAAVLETVPSPHFAPHLGEVLDAFDELRLLDTREACVLRRFALMCFAMCRVHLAYIFDHAEELSEKEAKRLEKDGDESGKSKDEQHREEHDLPPKGQVLCARNDSDKCPKPPSTPFAAGFPREKIVERLFSLMTALKIRLLSDKPHIDADEECKDSSDSLCEKAARALRLLSLLATGSTSVDDLLIS